MNIQIECVGTSALLMHNPRMADPQFDMNRDIKAITSKRKKTDQDLAEIERLEWFGGLYVEDGVVVQPSSKVRKCLVNTAKITKLGKAIERALMFDSIVVPLEYDGPRDIKELHEDERFTSRLSVGVSGKRVMRVRPKFPTWALTLTGMFVENAGLNYDELERIVELAGRVEGIGDYRTGGYGRFKGSIHQI